MRIIRHPKLADDIRDATVHYAEISERVLSAFWRDLDWVLASVARNPRSFHFDALWPAPSQLPEVPVSPA
jgi:hypothetical protein